MSGAGRDYCAALGLHPEFMRRCTVQPSVADMRPSLATDFVVFDPQRSPDGDRLAAIAERVLLVFLERAPICPRNSA